MKQKPTFYLSFQNTFIKIIYDISFEYNFGSMSFKRDFLVLFGKVLLIVYVFEFCGLISSLFLYATGIKQDYSKPTSRHYGVKIIVGFYMDFSFYIHNLGLFVLHALS